METIFALATAPGKAGVAIIRISGPRAHDAAEILAGRRPKLRQASLCTLKDASGTVLDTGLVLLFGKEASFTGENVAELQLHGARATIAAVLSALGAMDGLRSAEPGEFTRRAMENGCMDLTEVEGLADLIEAETEAQRKQALAILSGDFAKRVETWREDLVLAMSLVELIIDFADEEIPTDVTPEVRPRIERLISGISQELDGIKSAQNIRDGFEVAIIGPPNIGKSTLLNRLAQRDAALVTDIPGTTRDILELRMDLGGFLVTFLDTAGLRETSDQIEALGIERARARAQEADLRVILSDGGPLVMAPQSPDDLVLRGKGDDGGAAVISGKTGAGLSEFLAHITAVFADRAGNAGMATRERHRRDLEAAKQAMESAADRLRFFPEQADLLAE
ncbi:MAG: tRNA uridine-5-carboxymethylaminomethyl(34) synthesis GTPase MnmE, partial [Mangrovicoccus sp.]|nr:tRNA uridine-5-carboxymethylaminomethyl(34) synthesis GTPase MnmE [Mangrovicoccus sp.]